MILDPAVGRPVFVPVVVSIKFYLKTNLKTQISLTQTNDFCHS